MVALTVVISFIAIIYGIKSFNRKKYDKAILVLIFLYTNGFEIMPGETQGTLSYFNIGIIYMFIISFLAYNKNLIRFTTGTTLEKLYTVFILFLLSCAIFSIVYYKFAPKEVFRVIKWLFPFASVFLFRILTPAQFLNILNFLFKITLLLNIIFIIQCFTGNAILHSAFETRAINEFGIARFYNKPIFSTFVLFYLIINYKKYTRFFLVFSIGLLFTALLLTQNRLEIIAVTFSIAIIVLLYPIISMRRKILYSLLLIAALIPVNTIMEMRDKGSNIGTKEEIINILNGHYTPNDYLNGYNGTFTFRLAMITERMSYLSQRNLIENIWGLGMGHSDYEAIDKRYNFQIGTLTTDKKPGQLSSADFAWTQIFCQWGYGGTILFLAVYIYLILYFYRNRHLTLGIVTFGYLIMLLLCSFAGNTLANPNYHILPLMTFFYIKKTTNIQTLKCNENNSY